MENNNPLVSVIVVNYHQSEFLRENLESIFAQTYDNIEIIAGDANSKDDSISIYNQILKSGNRPYKTFYSDKKRDFNEMLNECIALSAGKYTKILSADDYLHPDFLTETVKFIEEKGKNCGMVFTDCFTVNENSKVIKDHLLRDLSIIQNGKLKLESTIERNRILVPGTLVKKDILLKTGSYTRGIAMEDYDRWMKIISISDIYYLDEKLAYYRRHKENKSLIEDPRLYFEDLHIKVQYDKTGIVQNKVNKSFAGLYIEQKKLPKYLIEAYSKYPYRTKILAFLLKNNIPPHLYKLFFRLRYGNNKI